MDEMDAANDRAQMDLERALKQRRPEGPAPTGHCLYCNAEIDQGHRWCDAECRNEWELMGRIKK